jgi:GDPmannose 4,6-dehydratase
MAFQYLGFAIRWEGEGVEEVGILDSINEQKYENATGQSPNLSISNLLNAVLIKVDSEYFRPTEVDLLLGDPTKSKTQLGWKPEYNLAGLVEDMMESDLKLMQKDLHLMEKGHEIFRQAE